MIYKIRTELEQGIALLAEAEEALKKGSLDVGTFSRLEQLSAATDAMVILRRQAAHRKGLKMFSRVLRIIGQGTLCVRRLCSREQQALKHWLRMEASFTARKKIQTVIISAWLWLCRKRMIKWAMMLLLLPMPYLIAGKANADKKIISGRIGSLRFQRKMQA